MQYHYPDSIHHYLRSRGRRHWWECLTIRMHYGDDGFGCQTSMADVAAVQGSVSHASVHQKSPSRPSVKQSWNLHRRARIVSVKNHVPDTDFNQISVLLVCQSDV